MDACSVTHGDKFFLTSPSPGSVGLSSSGLDVYGSNGAGRVVAVGANVPDGYADKPVAIYKSLVRSPATIGLWCERAVVPYESCLILPHNVGTRDYCGSFANVLTVYAFLEEMTDAGHRGVVVTAGNSATGRMAVSLARRRGVPAVFLVRSNAAREDLLGHGAEYVLVTEADGFENRLGVLAGEIGATAVFDGVGGALLSRIAPILPMNSTAYVYGFLGGATSISLPTKMVLGRNLALRRFSNFESGTVRNPSRLAHAIKEIESLIDNPVFRTRIGKEFRFDQIGEAMAYETGSGARAVLVI